MDWKNKTLLALSVLRYKLTARPIPIAVAWLITGRCNLNCGYCKWKQQRQRDELDTAAVLDMIDQMKRAGVRVISFTGGEPLVRSDIGQIIRHVKHRGLVCKLNTNGVLVPRRLGDLRALDLLQISLDGPPAVQDALRGPGTAQKATRAIRAAREAGIRVQLIACLTQDNVSRMDEVLDYGLQLGVGFCFQLLTTQGVDPAAVGRSVPERQQLSDCLRYLLRLRKEGHPRARAIASKTSELEYYVDLVSKGSPGCQCALVTATMLPDGRLIFCGNGKHYVAHDAVQLGFAQAFSRLTIPECDGCVCVGKLRTTKVLQMDWSVIKEMVGLWR